MARYTFGGTAADFVAAVGPDRLLRSAPANLTLWSAATGGTQHTDLRLAGGPVSSIPVGVDGQVPEFQGPDGVDELWASAGGAARVKLTASTGAFLRRADLASWPVFLYGNSYSILAAGWFTAGKHYAQLAAARLGAGVVTSYGISGKRILDVLSALVNQTAIQGLVTAPVAGALWPGTTTRNGLVVLESSFNDIGHYPTMVGTAIPAALPSANTRYRDMLRRQYRTALALMSSQSRIENAAFTVSGTWSRGVATGYASGGLVDFSTAVGAYSEVSVTPPQTGPLAGKVFLLTYALDPGTGATAATNITVDGVAAGAFAPVAWEQYVGPGGANVPLSWDVIPVTVPVDGNAHTVRFTHAGSAGQILYVDSLIVPSEDPNPIAVMGSEHGPKSGPVWTAAQANTWRGNQLVLTPEIKAAVAEFPNAIYVPSTLTQSGLYSGDGIHPNDRGMAQRTSDLVNALQSIKPRLDNRYQALRPDSDFAIV